MLPPAVCAPARFGDAGECRVGMRVRVFKSRAQLKRRLESVELEATTELLDLSRSVGTVVQRLVGGKCRVRFSSAGGLHTVAESALVRAPGTEPAWAGAAPLKRSVQEAILGYAHFYKLDRADITEQQIDSTSAGLAGWRKFYHQQNFSEPVVFRDVQGSSASPVPAGPVVMTGTCQSDCLGTYMQTGAKSNLRPIYVNENWYLFFYARRWTVGTKDQVGTAGGAMRAQDAAWDPVQIRAGAWEEHHAAGNGQERAEGWTRVPEVQISREQGRAPAPASAPDRPGAKRKEASPSTEGDEQEGAVPAAAKKKRAPQDRQARSMLMVFGRWCIPDTYEGKKRAGWPGFVNDSCFECGSKEHYARNGPHR
jgi:hypothetical protein